MDILNKLIEYLDPESANKEPKLFNETNVKELVDMVDRNGDGKVTKV